MKLERTKFRGHNAILVTMEGMILTVVTAFGPRIAELRRTPKGSSLLYWDAKGEKRRGDWLLRGGHRVWTWQPGADECEATYEPDNGGCTVTHEAPNILEVVGATSKRTGLARGIAVREGPSGGMAEVTSFVINQSEMLWSGGVWAITCIKTGSKSFGIPLGRPTGAGWDDFTVRVFRSWAGGHTSPGIGDRQLRWGERSLVVKPKGKETKLMLEVPQGWIGCYAPHEGASFFKRVVYDPASISLCPHGCNVALYNGPGNFMTEMETMGPWQTLRPGERLDHTERWILAGPERWKKQDLR